MLASDQSGDMLLQPPLFGQIRDYLVDGSKTGREVFVIAPYIKAQTLDDLLYGIESEIIVVTSWKKADLRTGASDLDVYKICEKHGAALYIHPNMHLKAYSVDLDSVILATANVSENGMGRKIPPVRECATLIRRLSSSDHMYLQSILHEAAHVDDRLYEKYNDWLSSQEMVAPTEGDDDPIGAPDADPFLTSSLPMTYSVDDLLDCYHKIGRGETIQDSEMRNCAFHDLQNYSLKTGLGDDEFIKSLRTAFFTHQFIAALDAEIPGTPGIRFGYAKEWVQTNCTDVPVPSRRDLTGNVQVLMSWFESLGEGKYVIHTPGSHSQHLYHKDR